MLAVLIMTAAIANHPFAMYDNACEQQGKHKASGEQSGELEAMI